jgi:hypothetical protein
MIEKKTGIQIFKEVYDNVLESKLKAKKWISKDSLIEDLKTKKKDPFKYPEPQSSYIIRVNHFIDKFIEELEEMEEENKFDEYNINIRDMHK